MTEADKPRKTPVLKIRSKSRSVDEFVARYCMDFSRSGMFIKTRQPFGPQTPLRFEFQLVDGTVVFSGKGSVVWKREDHEDKVRPAGMGVGFKDMEESAASLVERMVRSRGGRPSRFDDRSSQPPGSLEPATADAPEGLFSSIAARPIELGSSLPSPLAERLRSEPPASTPPPPPSGPPVAPDLMRAAEPYEEPMIENPEDELGAEMVEEGVDPRSSAAMGQLQSALSEAFEETVRRTSMPPGPGHDVDLLESAPPDELSLPPSERPRSYEPGFEHGPYTGRETALSDPARSDRLHSLVNKAKFDEPPSHFRRLTWWLMAILAVLITFGATLRYLGAEGVTKAMEPFADIFVPLMRELGL